MKKQNSEHTRACVRACVRVSSCNSSAYFYSPPQLINSRKKSSQEYEALTEEAEEAHWEVVERILFVYAKLNPGTSYVQGMNEIVGPLYYTLMSDPNPEWRGLCRFW